MEPLIILGLILGGLLIVVGVAGSVLPFLPGMPLIFIGTLVLGLADSFQNINVTVLIALGLITLFASIMQYLALGIGTKKLGSSPWGALGAITGLVLSLLLPGPLSLFSLILLPLILAFLFELAASASVHKSLKASLGSIIGLLGGLFTQILSAIIMVVIIIIAIF